MFTSSLFLYSSVHSIRERVSGVCMSSGHVCTLYSLLFPLDRPCKTATFGRLFSVLCLRRGCEPRVCLRVRFSSCISALASTATDHALWLLCQQNPQSPFASQSIVGDFCAAPHSTAGFITDTGHSLFAIDNALREKVLVIGDSLTAKWFQGYH